MNISCNQISNWRFGFTFAIYIIPNMTSFNFITFAKINAECQCYNCLSMLNMVLKRFGSTLIANDVNKILWNKFSGTRWGFVYSCRQRTVRIECCIKSAALSLFGSHFSAAAARTDTSQVPRICISYSKIVLFVRQSVVSAFRCYILSSIIVINWWKNALITDWWVYSNSVIVLGWMTIHV